MKKRSYRKSIATGNSFPTLTNHPDGADLNLLKNPDDSDIIAGGGGGNPVGGGTDDGGGVGPTPSERPIPTNAEIDAMTCAELEENKTWFSNHSFSYQTPADKHIAFEIAVSRMSLRIVNDCAAPPPPPPPPPPALDDTGDDDVPPPPPPPPSYDKKPDTDDTDDEIIAVMVPPIVVPYKGGAGGGSGSPAAPGTPNKYRNWFWIAVGITTTAGFIFFNKKANIAGGVS